MTAHNYDWRFWTVVVLGLYLVVAMLAMYKAGSKS